MARIIQLSENVANQISAGEVIERPASVVKELIENSIDATSKNILIEIANGGKGLIRIKDDGTGIAGDDIKLAFSRYATSKIKEINDLYSIKTLGFRGEALSSIAAVSKIEITSRTADELSGVFLSIEGSTIVDNKKVGAPIGTDIIVKDLFYNTPARYKYLKKVNTEFGHISNIVYREALTRPDIRFTLKHNEREIINTPGTGKILDTIYAIYGEDVAKNLLEVDFSDRYIEVKGYTANPRLYRSSRIYEQFFVNGRTVYNQILYRGVESAYKGLIPVNTYPVCFLNLKLNQILVDVNVHPTKREVKFSRDEIIQDVLKKGIINHLKEHDLTPGIRIKNVQEKVKKENKGTQFNFKNVIDKKETGEKNPNTKISLPIVQKRELNTSLFNNDINKSKEKDYTENSDKDFKHTNTTNNSLNGDIAENNSLSYQTNQNKMQDDHPSTPVKKILGQIKYTYIVVEGYDGLFIIDQHNAHERILYDKIYSKYQNDQILSQSILTPTSFDLTVEEIEILKKYLPQLQKLGFKIEPFGVRSYILQEVPLSLKNIAGNKIVEEFIDNIISSRKTMNPAEFIKETIAYTACRGAIKAGQRLASEEIVKLIKDLFQCENPNRCPHGRPIIINLTDQEIERGMGRA